MSYCKRYEFVGRYQVEYFFEKIVEYRPKCCSCHSHNDLNGSTFEFYDINNKRVSLGKEKLDSHQP